MRIYQYMRMPRVWILGFVVLVLISFFVLSGNYTIEVARGVRSFFGGNNSLVDTIQEGVALLKASPPLEYTTTKKQIALAIYDRRKQNLFEKRIWVDDAQNITDATTDNIEVRILWWNYFNSVYEIIDHPEMVVVANKFLMLRSTFPETAIARLGVDAPTSKYINMTYAPYSEYIHWPDVIVAGKKYLTHHIDEAYRQLRTDAVESRSSPGLLITEVISEDLLKNIVLTEQVDPGWLRVADDGGKALVERVFVIIGANREWAYRYTSSKAGAYGIGQFIESTYDTLADRYPSANLIADRSLGMADHTNAFKAIALLFDNDRTELMKKIPVVTEEMLAAAYNGGPSRVITAVRLSSDGWADSKHIAEETRDYVQKFKAIKKLKAF